jgi:hypothetical protein
VLAPVRGTQGAFGHPAAAWQDFVAIADAFVISEAIAEIDDINPKVGRSSDLVCMYLILRASNREIVGLKTINQI